MVFEVLLRNGLLNTEEGYVLVSAAPVQWQEDENGNVVHERVDADVNAGDAELPNAAMAVLRDAPGYQQHAQHPVFRNRNQFLHLPPSNRPRRRQLVRICVSDTGLTREAVHLLFRQPLRQQQVLHSLLFHVTVYMIRCACVHIYMCVCVCVLRTM